MKNILHAYLKAPLILRIAAGLVIGIAFGLAAPGAGVVALFGTIFVGALKGVAPVLVFVTNVGKNIAINSNFASVIGRNIQAALRHHRKEAERFKRYGFTARIGTGYDKRVILFSEFDRNGNHLTARY